MDDAPCSLYQVINKTFCITFWTEEDAVSYLNTTSPSSGFRITPLPVFGTKPNALTLQNYCQEFIKDTQISCADAIYQSERVIENATSFIERVCEIVGYHKIDGEEE